MQSEIRKTIYMKNRKRSTIFINRYNKQIDITTENEKYQYKTNIFMDIKIVELIDMDQPGSKSKSFKYSKPKTKILPVGFTKNPVVIKNNLVKIRKVHNFEKTENKKIQPVIEEVVAKFKEINFDNTQEYIQNNQLCCVQICKEQEGSRYIQDKLDLWTQSDVEIFFETIIESFVDLSTNVFGNYVVQKIIKQLNETQLVEIFYKIYEHIGTMSLNIYGCRVIQIFLELCKKYELTQFNEIVSCLQNNFEEITTSSYGNHVMQKCMELDGKNMLVIKMCYEAHKYAKEKYGCRIIQNMLQNKYDMKVSVIEDLKSNLLSNASTLITDQYGNYVLQILIQDEKYKKILLDYVVMHCKELSLCKFSSNIVEKYVNTTDKNIIDQFFEQINVVLDDKPFILTMIQDGCANYVVQTLYNYSSETQKKIIQDIIKENYTSLQNVPWFKSMYNKMSHKKKN